MNARFEDTGTRWEHARWATLGLLIGLLLGGLGAGFAWFNGQQQLAAVRTAHVAQADRAAADVTAMRLDLDASRSTVALLRARVAAARAVEELDRSNFGLAREQLRAASTALADVDAQRAGIDPAALDTARTQIQATLAQVPPDAATNRASLVEVERLIDVLVPGAAARG